MVLLRGTADPQNTVSGLKKRISAVSVCGFIAQLVEHRTGIAEVTGSNLVEALIFQASSFQLLKLENLLR